MLSGAARMLVDDLEKDRLVKNYQFWLNKALAGSDHPDLTPVALIVQRIPTTHTFRNEVYSDASRSPDELLYRKILFIDQQLRSKQAQLAKAPPPPPRPGPVPIRRSKASSKGTVGEIARS